MDLGLTDRACIVTGASRGIGRATARLLAAEGAAVLLVARGADELEEAVGEIAGAGGRAVGLSVDVTGPEAAERVAAACKEAFGPPWALVNSAGFARVAGDGDLSEESWQAQWEIHVMAPLRLMRTVAPMMCELGGGRIVNVTSSSAKRPSATLEDAYSVTKAAQQALSRRFADRYAGDGVLVNAVAPGGVRGTMWLEPGGLADQLAEKQGTTREEALAAIAGRIPRGELASEEEIAAVIAFLCSRQASNVAGAAWAVDGGAVPTAF
jgi:3-oxoacyl-[acyl-carrier protein] reductase